ncbi:hypothetical protein DF286_00940 [Sphingosinicella humi]|uniref:Uncharacterized protein n=1 Tax=Allosphingosinicella humi TaxID=2068657 RepID=A0A2U2IZU8_9SPHN|nr:hypothetical protein DF286_00940 [Sphingosinicella humi]
MKAISVGTLTGGLIPLCLTLPLAVSNYFQPMSGRPDLLASVYLAGFPIAISFGLVLATSVVVGLPTHFMLRKWHAGSRPAYLIAGAIAGFLVPLMVLVAIEAVGGFWMCFLGAFSGSMTALSWSNSFERARVA